MKDSWRNPIARVLCVVHVLYVSVFVCVCVPTIMLYPRLQYTSPSLGLRLVKHTRKVPVLRMSKPSAIHVGLSLFFASRAWFPAYNILILNDGRCNARRVSI